MYHLLQKEYFLKNSINLIYLAQLDGNDSDDSDEPRLEIVEEENADKKIGDGRRKLRTRVKSESTCSTCGKSFKNLDELMKHKNYECGKEKKFKCPNCNEGFAYKFKLTGHVKNCKKDNNIKLNDQVVKSEIPKTKIQSPSQGEDHSESVKAKPDATNKAKSDTTKEVPANMPLKKRKVPAVFDADDKAGAKEVYVGKRRENYPKMQEDVVKEDEKSNKNEQNDVMDSPSSVGEKLVKFSSSASSSSPRFVSATDSEADDSASAVAVHHSENTAGEKLVKLCDDSDLASEDEKNKVKPKKSETKLDHSENITTTDDNSKSSQPSQIDRTKKNEKKDNFLGNIMESTSHMIKAKKAPVVNSKLDCNLQGRIMYSITIEYSE